MKKVDKKNQIRQNRILRTLLEQGEMSLTDLAKMTGMTLPMVSKVVGTLRAEKYLEKSGEKEADRVGRPPIVTRLNGAAGFILGIDIGHLNTNMVLLNLRQTVIREVHRQSITLGNSLSLIDNLTKEMDEMLKNAGVEYSRLLGVGISIPGIVRGREGRSETYLNFGEVPVRELLQERWQKPVAIEHDAKAMALGERWFGSARHGKNVLCLNVGWGLGLGIMIDGRIYYGRDGYAGEFGHMQLDGNQKPCQCGKLGCLETVASGRAIAELARERLAKGAKSILLEDEFVGGIDAERVVKAATAGDAFSISILEEAGHNLGEGIAKLINLFNPDLIILGGRVSQAGDLFLDPVRNVAMQRSLPQLNQGVRFTVSELSANAGALGVAMLAARDIFEVDHLNPSAFV